MSDIQINIQDVTKTKSTILKSHNDVIKIINCYETVLQEMQQVIDKLNECRLLYVPEVKDMKIYACQLGEDELVRKYTDGEG